MWMDQASFTVTVTDFKQTSLNKELVVQTTPTSTLQSLLYNEKAIYYYYYYLLTSCSDIIVFGSKGETQTSTRDHRSEYALTCKYTGMRPLASSTHPFNGILSQH